MKRRAYLVMQQHSTYNKRIGKLFTVLEKISTLGLKFFSSKRGGSRRADAYHQVSGLAAGLDSSFWSCTLALMIQCIWEPSKTELSFDGNFMFIQQQTW